MSFKSNIAEVFDGVKWIDMVFPILISFGVVLCVIGYTEELKKEKSNKQTMAWLDSMDRHRPPVKFRLMVQKDGNSSRYCIRFSNDNMRLSRYLYMVMECANCRKRGGGFMMPLAWYTALTFETEKEAIDFARSFNTYEKCVAYNNAVSRKVDQCNEEIILNMGVKLDSTQTLIY